MPAGQPGSGPERKAGSQGEDAADSYRKAAPYLDASWQLVGSVGVWTVVGWWLDGRFKTSPWLLVAGALLGIGLGFWLFFRALLDIGKRKQE